jgi:hypothetical protein
MLSRAMLEKEVPPPRYIIIAFKHRAGRSAVMAAFRETSATLELAIQLLWSTPDTSATLLSTFSSLWSLNMRTRTRLVLVSQVKYGHHKNGLSVVYFVHMSKKLEARVKISFSYQKQRRHATSHWPPKIASSSQPAGHDVTSPCAAANASYAACTALHT